MKATTLTRDFKAEKKAKKLLELTEQPRVTIEELREAIDKGADVNVKGKYGVTPLHNLIYNGNYEAVEFLLKQGADIAMCNSIGRNSLHIAAFKNNLKIVELLLKQGTLTDEDKNKKDDDKNQPLYWAIKNENYEMIKKLLENGANPNVDSTEGNLFRLAVESCEEKIGLLLLKSGAEIEPNEYTGKVHVFETKSDIKEICVDYRGDYFANHVVVTIIKKSYFELFLQLLESEKIDLTKDYRGAGNKTSPLSFLDAQEIPKLLDLLSKNFSYKVSEKLKEGLKRFEIKMAWKGKEGIVPVDYLLSKVLKIEADNLNLVIKNVFLLGNRKNTEFNKLPKEVVKLITLELLMDLKLDLEASEKRIDGTAIEYKIFGELSSEYDSDFN